MGKIFSLASCITLASAIGLMAGPDNPPNIFPSFGLKLSISIAVPITVFTNDIASAPPLRALVAVSIKLSLFGLNFAIKGISKIFLTEFITDSTWSGIEQKAIPPLSTFGHEKFISTAIISSFMTFTSLAILKNSSLSSPKILRIILTCRFFKTGNCSFIK